MNKNLKLLRSSYLEVEDDFSRILDQMEVDLFEFQAYEILLNEHFETVNEKLDPLLIFLRAQENLNLHLKELRETCQKCHQLHKKMMATQ